RNLAGRDQRVGRVEHPLTLVRKRQCEHAAGEGARPEKSGARISAVALRVKCVRAAGAVRYDEVRAVLAYDGHVTGEIPAVADGRIRRPDARAVAARKREVRADAGRDG